VTTSLPVLATAVLLLLTAAYLLYGRWLAREFRLSDETRTPAHELGDAHDFVPTPRFYLLGQHFSAIAAAGPIAGPIAAATTFGWLPSLLWIMLGVVFIGAVHDFTALVASVRHRAMSIAEIVREHVGRRAWAAMLVFIWIALVYVILAFTDVTAATFVGTSEELAGLDGAAVTFNRGGAVAMAAVLYLLLAVVMGAVQRLWKPPLWLVTLVFVPATLGVIWLGTKLSTVLVLGHATWGFLILAYCAVASVIPVWTLLQPRGYLGGFILYAVLAIGVWGVLFGGFDVRLPQTQDVPLAGLGTTSMLPFLFVTIACGACSGFHGLVCSGTTSKQIDKESHCRTVGYGAMLLEGLVAVIALATVMILTREEAAAAGGPPAIYGKGVARFLCSIVGEEHLLFATVFGTMAFSTFVFDTLDVATRLGRFILQELTGTKGVASSVIATLATAGVPAAIFAAAGRDSFKTFWTLFGTSNQLLAALTLLGVSVWLHQTGRRCWYAVVPMVLLMGITLWSLLGQSLHFWSGISKDGAVQAAPLANFCVAVVLAVLALYFVFHALRAFLRGRPAPAAA
jgi:carbon starvation protein